MRKVQITAQGPLGWKDTVDVFSEDALLLTFSGEVKAVRTLREGDVLIRFSDASGGPYRPHRWSISKIEWLRKEVHHGPHSPSQSAAV
jgi:hypothetical protein